MINKTFNSDSTDGGALEVGRNGERPWLNIREFDLENTMFILAPSDAPALALAILEAAGVPWNVDTPLGRAAVELDKHVTLEAKAIAEAEAQAKLEAEALELVNAWMDSCGAGKYPSWAHVETGRREQGLAVALRARELNKESTK